MGVVRHYCRTITALNRAVMAAASMLIFVMVPAICIGVVSRYFFGVPVVWSVELPTLLLGPYFMMTGPYLLHIGGHVNVDILYARLPRRAAAALDCLTIPLIVLFALIMIDLSWPLAVNAFTLGETSYSAWNPPVWWTKFFLPLGLALLAAQAVAEFLSAVTRTFGRSEPMP